MSDEPKGFTLPIQWENVVFPKTRAYCAKLTIVSQYEIMDRDTRDFLRHLVDDDAKGNFIYIDESATEQEAAEPKQIERSVDPKARSASQNLRFAIETRAVEEGCPDDKAQIEAWYQRRMNEIVSNEWKTIETLRQDRHYAGQF